MIFSLVAMTGLEKCYITSAYLHCNATQVSDPRPVSLLFILSLEASIWLGHSVLQTQYLV